MEMKSVGDVQWMLEDGWKVFAVSIDATGAEPDCTVTLLRGDDESVKMPVTLDTALTIRDRIFG